MLDAEYAKQLRLDILRFRPGDAAFTPAPMRWRLRERADGRSRCAGQGVEVVSADPAAGRSEVYLGDKIDLTRWFDR